MTAAAATEARKTAFRDWLDAWVRAHQGQSADVGEIVDAAAQHFAPARFSDVIRSKEPPRFGKIHAKVVEFMRSGMWVSDYYIADHLGVSVTNAGARRRDLRKFGYTILSRETTPGNWQHRLVSFPPEA